MDSIACNARLALPYELRLAIYHHLFAVDLEVVQKVHFLRDGVHLHGLPPQEFCQQQEKYRAYRERELKSQPVVCWPDHVEYAFFQGTNLLLKVHSTIF